MVVPFGPLHQLIEMIAICGIETDTLPGCIFYTHAARVLTKHQLHWCVAMVVPFERLNRLFEMIASVVLKLILCRDVVFTQTLRALWGIFRSQLRLIGYSAAIR